MCTWYHMAHSTFKVTYTCMSMGSNCHAHLICTYIYSVIQLLAPHTLYYLAAAVCVSCQELTSTLREGNRACPGEEVIFTCTIRGPSSLQVIAVAWSSAEYIGQGSLLQLSTANMIGAVETSTDMDGNITATAMVTNNANVNGELILESTLNITAVMTSVVTCSGINGFTATIVSLSGACTVGLT